MNVYLARLIQNKEVVGLFAAENMRDLFWAIDEVTNPYECEWIEAPSGAGVCFHNPNEPSTDDWDEDITAAAAPSDVLLCAMLDTEEEDVDWQAFDHGDEAQRRFFYTGAEPDQPTATLH